MRTHWLPLFAVVVASLSASYTYQSMQWGKCMAASVTDPCPPGMVMRVANAVVDFVRGQ